MKAGKDIALANKETLVTAGHIIMPLAEECGVQILPVDSEHSAIFQCLHGENRKEIDRLLWDKLPDSLSEVQKKNKIHNLLTSMKNKNLIEKDSDNQQKSNWVLK